MKKLRIVICDDTPEELGGFENLCRSICKKHNVDMELKCYESGDILLTYLDDPKYFTKVDIILLDINMPGTDGVKAAELIRSYGYKGIIIFITVSDNKEHFKKAFNVKASNYYIKGEDSSEQFEDMFLESVKSAQDSNSKIVTLYCGGGEYKQFEIKHIIYFEAMQRFVNVWYKDRQIECVSKIGDLEEQFDGLGFLRIHRGYLVNLSHVSDATYTEVILKDGKTLAVGRKYQKNLKETMKNLKT